MTALWPRGQQSVSMESFISDKRLAVWFVQNYDAVGCNVYTYSSLLTAKHSNLLQTLIPIPIGLDLHSFGSASALLKRNQVNYTMIGYDQFRILRFMRSFILPLHKRIPRSIVTSFECSFDQTKIGQARKRGRGSICSVLESTKLSDPSQVGSNGPIVFIEGVKVVTNSSIHNSTFAVDSGRIILPRNILDSHHLQINHKFSFFEDIVHALSNEKSDKWEEKETRRMRFWMTLSLSKFSIAPPGFGMDTHR